MAQAAKRIEPEPSGDDIKQRLTGFEQRLVVLETKSQHFVSDAALADFRTEVLTAIANLGKEIADARAEAADRESRQSWRWGGLLTAHTVIILGVMYALFQALPLK